MDYIIEELATRVSVSKKLVNAWNGRRVQGNAQEKSRNRSS